MAKVEPLSGRFGPAGPRGGPNVRNCGLESPLAKTVSMPAGVNSRISPLFGTFSVTKRLPALSKAKPRGDLRPVAKVLSMPPGVNSRIDPMVKSDVRVETKRLPALSKANCPPKADSLPKAAGPAKVVRV